MESPHKAGVLLALDGLHPGTGPPFRRHGSDDEYREVGMATGILCPATGLGNGGHCRSLARLWIVSEVSIRLFGCSGKVTAPERRRGN